MHAAIDCLHPILGSDASNGTPRMNTFHWIDAAIIAVYAALMIGLGWYFNRGQRTAAEYFVGNRAMPPVLIGISLFATLLSTISYLSVPGEVIKHGPVMLIGGVAVFVSYFIISLWLIPAFMRRKNLTTAYELLEDRLGLSSRMAGSGLFITLRLMWMSVLLNFAAQAMLVMIGADDDWLPLVAVLIGSVALLYSSLGGLRAVVITDLLQFILLFLGGVLVVVFVSVRMDGFDWWPTEWQSNWDSQPFISFDPYMRMTVVGVVLMQTLWSVCTYGSDQTAVQRYLSTRDLPAAKQAFLVNSIVDVIVMLMLSVVGFALLGYFQEFPARLPDGQSITDAADGLFPHFIANELPVGVSGLVISGMFAAAMSSVDSGVNSISAVVTTDFVGRFRKESFAESAQLKAAKATAVCVGILVIFGSTLIEYVPGNFLEVSKKVIGMFVTPMFTLFAMALFVPFATARGANIGAFCGLVTAIVIAYWDPLIEDRAISFTFINPVSLTVSMLVGCVVSLIERRIRR